MKKIGRISTLMIQSLVFCTNTSIYFGFTPTDIWTKAKIGHFRNKKEPGAEKCPAMFQKLSLSKRDAVQNFFCRKLSFIWMRIKIIRGFNLHVYGKRQTANVTFNFRISQNRKLEDKNSSQQFLRIQYYVKLLIYV